MDIEMIKTKINGKYELYLPKHRAVRPEWETGWESERIDAMLSVLKKGDLVLDIGVEEGDISALLAQKTGKMVLFEPNEKVWSNIKAIWQANNLPDPIDIWVGFASASTETLGVDFNKTFSWPKCAYGELISDHGFKELAYEHDIIPQVKIDDFMRNIIDQVKLITIDVEGSEFEVLKGAVEIIKRDKPYIFVSVHPEFMFHMFNQYTAELVGFVQKLGYTYEVLAFDHEFHFKFSPKNS